MQEKATYAHKLLIFTPPPPASISTYSGQLLDELVALAEGGEPDLLGELGEGGVGEQRDVADQLVDDVRLGGVHRLGGVADVLGGVEHAEREAGQEVPRAETTGHGAELEAGRLCDRESYTS